MPLKKLSKKAEYQLKGYGSTVKHPEGQTEMFPETDTTPPIHELPGIESLTPRQLERGQQQVGKTVRQVKNRFGSILDDIFATAGAARHLADPNGEDTSPIYGPGQDNYSGGPGTEREIVGQMARKGNVPYHTAAAIKATLAQNTGPVQENEGTRQILEQHSRNVPPNFIKTKNVGVLDTAVRSATKHLRDYDAEPTQTPKRGVPGSKNASTAKAMPGHKIPGYYQSYAHANHPKTRAAIDRHMFRAANPKLSDVEISDIQGSLGTRKTTSALDDAIVAPAHHVVHEGLSLAAAERGLTKDEAQTLIWHWQNPQTPEQVQAVSDSSLSSSSKQVARGVTANKRQGNLFPDLYTDRRNK